MSDNTPLLRTDPWRPAFQYTPAQHWVNDPNGLVWHNGSYHLYYQHNPFGNTWGHMSWGHAVSSNLVDWQELPVAIAEDERVSIYSGSVVFDAANSSGFGSAAPQPLVAPLVAVYTGCLRVPTGEQAQELAYSTDSGHTWTKHAGNPVLDLGLRDFRDPKVFWHAPSARWVMVVVVPDDRTAKFFASGNLKDWTWLSDFSAPFEGDGIWECPDLIAFDTAEGTVWMLKVDVFGGHASGGTGARLFFGHFDGTRFTPEPEAVPVWADAGSDFYAALSWAHLPTLPGQPQCPMWLAWMNCHRYAKHTPTAPWRGAMTVPRALQLRRSATGAWQLLQQPVAALQRLRGAVQLLSDITVADGHALPLLANGTDGSAGADGTSGALDARTLELQLEITAASGDCALLLRAAGHSAGQAATRVGYDACTGTVYVDRSQAGFNPPDDALYPGRRSVAVPAPNTHQPLRLHVLLDRCSVEVFVGDGHACITELIFPDDAHRGVWLQARGGSAHCCSVLVWPLAAAAIQ